jgi:hypothetical protein
VGSASASTVQARSPCAVSAALRASCAHDRADLIACAVPRADLDEQEAPDRLGVCAAVARDGREHQARFGPLVELHVVEAGEGGEEVPEGGVDTRVGGRALEELAGQSAVVP